MPEIKINYAVPPLKKGEVRVMFNDGDGLVVMDFEPGQVNEELRTLVHGFLKKGKF